MLQKNCLIFITDQKQRMLVKKTFEELGFKTKQVTSCEQVMNALKDGIPHVIMIDLCQPYTEKIDFIKYVRHQEPYHCTYIIGMVEERSRNSYITAYALGGDDCIREHSELKNFTHIL